MALDPEEGELHWQVLNSVFSHDERIDGGDPSVGADQRIDIDFRDTVMGGYVLALVPLLAP